MKRRDSFTALTIGVGVFLAGFEMLRNWGDWQPWPAWVIEYVAAILLVAAGLRGGRSPRGHAYLYMAWGFLAAVLTGSLMGNIHRRHAINNGPVPQKPYPVMVGLFFLYTVTMTIWSIEQVNSSFARPRA